MQMRLVLAIAMALLVNLPALVLAQQPSTQKPKHNHTFATISGKDHPELIPDVTAYSLVLSVLSVPANATDQDRAGSISHIKRIGLDAHDTLQLVAITDAFRAQHDALLKTLNDSIIPIPAGPASQPDNKGFEQSHQALVLSAVEQIKSELSPDGVEAFLHHVQTEKANMAISGGVQ
jgi:hypothetical protein